MNDTQIIDRVAVLTDPVIVNIDMKSFDDKLLLEKCELMNSLNRLMGTSIKDSLLVSVKKTVWELIQIPVFSKMNDKKVTLLGYSMLENTWDSIWYHVKASYWNSVKCVMWDAHWNMMKEVINSTIKEASYIHAFSKFTTAEFRSLLKHQDEEDKERQIRCQSLFKGVDWFWEHGLCCFKGITKNDYYVCPYDDPRQYKKVTIADVLE